MAISEVLTGDLFLLLLGMHSQFFQVEELTNRKEPVAALLRWDITQPLDSIRYMVYNGYYKVMSNIPILWDI